MVRLLHHIGLWMMCLVLSQAAFPTTAAMACVTEAGRIVDLCPEGGHRPPAAKSPPRTCCHLSAVVAYNRQNRCLTDGGVHCATVAQAKHVPSVHLELPAPGNDAPAMGNEAPLAIPAAPRSRTIANAFPDDADPPTAGVHVPDLGRAPPII